VTFQAAQNEGRSAFLRQVLQFFVEDRLQLVRGRFSGFGWGFADGAAAFAQTALGGNVFGHLRNPVSDSVQPTGSRLALADGRGPAGQDQERETHRT